MYDFSTRTKKAEKQFKEILDLRPKIILKLKELQEDPRRKLHAHKLKGKLAGLWSCYLGSDVRLMYKIDEKRN